MSSQEVDQYLAGFSGAGLVAAQRLREQLLAAIPEGEEGISYSMPVIKLEGKAIAGWAINKAHLGYYPHSSLVLDKAASVKGMKMSKGALQIPFDQPLTDEQVHELVKIRMDLLGI